MPILNIRKQFNIGLIILISSINGCFADSQNPYQLNIPSSGFQLNSELNEISGLHYYSDTTLIAVQDEKAIIYFINSKKGEITNTYSFGKKGDYEGVTASNNIIYVLKSNGNITVINTHKQTKKTIEFKNSKGFDFEGLCIDNKNNRLLVACKTHADKKKNNFMRIYGVDLKSMSYLKAPVYKIDKSNISKHFNPSGIAIHPNENIYILSSTAKSLVTLSSSGKVLRINTLFKPIFNQPEGITFSPNGDLFISNEKKNMYPTLLKFDIK